MSIWLALALQGAAQAPVAAPTPSTPPPTCASDSHAAFDFWVGEWDVFPNGSDKPVAQSRIERLHNGCAIREQWQVNSPAGGSSLTTLDAATGRWNQNWIGSDGVAVHFEGGMVGNAMVLTGYWNNITGPGQHGLVRMTYTPLSDGAVRQHGELSLDHGLTWSTNFDFVYRKKEGAAS